ncbi:MAG: serine hydrolase domain-containing protein, partial [Bryobacteraceae bacterium]
RHNAVSRKNTNESADVTGVLLARVVFAALFCPIAAVAQTLPSGSDIDAKVAMIMTRTHARGMAVALIDHGKVGYVRAYGIRNAMGDPLTTDTVMYGASLTKTVFAYVVMQLVDQGSSNSTHLSRRS